MFNLSPIYFGLLLAIFLCLVLAPRKWWPFFLLMSVMTFIGVFRGLEVGTDHAGYEYDFEIMKSWSDLKRIYHNFEVGYVGLIILFKQFSSNYLLFSGLTFLAPMIGTYYFVKNYKVAPAWALYAFYATGIYFSAFNVMRQYMAICAIAAFTPLLYKRKYGQFAIITIAISLLFHKSSLIMLILIGVFWLVYDKRIMISKNILYLISIGSFCLWYVGSHFIVKLFLPVLSLVELESRFSGYLINENENLGNSVSLLNTLFTIAAIYFCPKTKYRAELLIIVLYCILFNIFNMLANQATRVALPFQYYMVALIPMILYSLKGRKRLIFAIGAFFYCFIQFYVYYCVNNYAEVNPYTNWLLS